MKYIGISGGWRKTNNEVENAVRKTVREIIMQGNGIVSGGALGVDSVALAEALRQNPKGEKIKIFLPTSLEIYAAHYHKRAQEEVITIEKAKNLINQLSRLKTANPESLIENQKNTVVNKETYFERNSEIVKASDELIAFYIISEMSDGLGTRDTIAKAKAKGIPVKIFTFNLTEKQ